LPTTTVCTAIVYFHHFFGQVSIEQADPQLVIQACLFLASKVEENSRRLRDIINCTHRLQYPRDSPLEVSVDYWPMKDALIRCEHQLLRILGFRLEFQHPHHYVLHIIRDLEGKEELASVAYYILNDSMCTTLCLQYQPQVVACAAIYLAGEMVNDRYTLDGEWWDKYNVNSVDIEDVCNQILDLYDSPDLIFAPRTSGTPSKPAESKSISTANSNSSSGGSTGPNAGSSGSSSAGGGSGSSGSGSRTTVSSSGIGTGMEKRLSRQV